MSQWLHGWCVFFDLLRKQRRKRHGKGKRDWLTAIYVASCGRQIADLQHRAPGKMPIEGRIAQWLAHGAVANHRSAP